MNSFPTPRRLQRLWTPPPPTGLTEAREAAATLGVQLRVLVAGSDSELDSAFATLNRERADAMVVTTSPFFVSRAKQIVALVARYRVPAIYARRQYAEAGGLMSY